MADEITQDNTEVKVEVTNPEQVVADKMFPENGNKKADPVVENKVENKTTEVKPGEETKTVDAKTATTEEIKITLPENSYLEQKDLDDILALAKEHGLNNKQAQALVAKQNSKMASFIEGQVESFKAKISEYENTVKADKELGGEKFNQSISHAKRVLEKYGNEQLMKELDSTGFGSHPEVIRILARIGKAMGDDQLISPNAKASTAMSIEERIYGKQK